MPAYAALFAVMCLAQPDTPAAKDDLAMFQGKWKLISALRDGKQMSAAEAKKFSLTITGNKFVLRKGAQIVSEGTFTLDATKTPREIDESISSGPNKGKNFGAIYEINKLEHKICFAAPGKDRPKTFSSEPGSGQLYQVWRRFK